MYTYICTLTTYIVGNTSLVRRGRSGSLELYDGICCCCAYAIGCTYDAIGAFGGRVDSTPKLFYSARWLTLAKLKTRPTRKEGLASPPRPLSVLVFAAAPLTGLPRPASMPFVPFLSACAGVLIQFAPPVLVMPVPPDAAAAVAATAAAHSMLFYEWSAKKNVPARVWESDGA